MKIIFLDIDGVLNHNKHYTDIPENTNYPYTEFNKLSISYLNNIIDKTDAEIVVSSSWRLEGIDKLNKIFRQVGISKPIYDITPDLLNKYNTTLCRGKEINMWLDNHKDVTDYVIFDDDTDMEENQLQHFIKTNAYADGLNETCMLKAINILNGYGKK